MKIKYQTVDTFPISNTKIVKGAKSLPHNYTTGHLSWFGTCTSIQCIVVGVLASSVVDLGF